MAKFLILLGAVLIVVGVVVHLAGVNPAGVFSKFSPWLGRLPGDIVIKRENFSFYFPIATSILLSIVLSLIFWLFRR